MGASANLASCLEQASAALRRGEVGRARSLLETLDHEHAGHPDRQHLLALVHKAAGESVAAEQCFRASLAARPDQPSVWSNLGNLLKQTGRVEESDEAYRQALRLDPEHLDARRNLGLLLAAIGRDAEAVDVLQTVVARNGRDTASWTTLGQCYRRLGQLDRSADCFREVLAIRPQHVNALAGLGVTLRMLGRPEDAAGCFDAALELTPGAVELMLSRAEVAADLGQFDEAAKRYRSLLRQAPTHVATHVQLSDLLWQTGAARTYGESFAETLAAHPDSPALLAAWCQGLVDTGAGDVALQQLQRRGDLVEKHPDLLAALAKRLASRGDDDSASRSFRQALSLAPDDPQLCLDFAQFSIYQGNYDDALAALSVAERTRPDDQLLWACRGLCWRLMGDERALWLNDEALLIRSFEIDCPTGYGTLDNFLTALAETLAAIHRTRAAPAHQSLRGGTQTAARLFYRQDPVIQDLRRVLSQAVARYIEALPDDPQHPMLRRRSSNFRFAGSWSVRLRSGGYHVNHVHPQGWISSSHYVTVPVDIGSSPDDPAGWLKFGESGLGLGDREVVSRLVKPEPGRVTLFPSYFWHGTVPFHSAEPRLTTPFDVVPAR